MIVNFVPQWVKEIVKSFFIPIKYYSERRELSKKIKAARLKHNYAIISIATPMHGNLGDHAIVYAQKQVFKDMGLKESVVEIDNIFYYYNKKFIKKLVTNNDIIVIDGGGNLGTLWSYEDSKITEIINSYLLNKVVVFPQTCYYSNSEEAKCKLELNNKVYQQAKDLTIALRDQQSYDFCKNNFSKNVNIVLVPDIVLYLNDVCKGQVVERTGVLLCLRKDLERVITIDDQNKLKEALNRRSIEFGETTTVVNYPVSIHTRDIELQKKWNEFASSKLIITDRLHGMIFAIITGTPCIAIDNLSKKVSGVYNIIEPIKNVKVCNNIDEIIDSIEYYYNFKQPVTAPQRSLDIYIKLISNFK